MTCSLEKGFPDGSMVKNPPANAWDAGLIVEVWEDPLEEEMTTHSSVLAWEILWTEEPGVLQSIFWGHKESDTTEQQNFIGL